jgi:lipopolysaccharide/colanic/teichoic acid biosynthesis glycosyltransferase
MSTWYPYAKRALDLIGACTLLAMSGIFLIAIAIAVKLDSPGPALYRGRRVGRNRELFDVFKFRTMQHNASDEPHRRFVQHLLRSDTSSTDGEMYKLTDDERITRVGRLLRRWSIDELPQLLNVVRGEMSLVGPRPEVPYALDGYRPEDFRRFDVLPGMTGLWQVCGRGNLSPRQMLDLDREYAEAPSLSLDLRLLLRTAPAVLSRIGSA